ncbi:MAG TPA: hypothetical protein VN702_02920 [Acetobacteraceae bacterium]|nr:hypothetical protein [Acetobacteraceae bacterium]
MMRIFLVVVAVGLLAIAAGVFALGMFPPAPQTHQVEKTLPNDKFQTH